MTKRITGVIHSVSRGGAEKNFVALFNQLAQKGYQCSVLCLRDPSGPEYQLSKNIEVTVLKKRCWLKSFLLIDELRTSLLRLRPECVISFMDQTNILTLLALWKNSSIPVIVCERNNPARNLIIGRRFPAILRSASILLRNFIYRRATCICTQTKGAEIYFNVRCKKTRTIAIANYVETIPDELSQQRQPLILSVARLVPEKGLADLIEVFAKIKKLFPEWRLEIYGDGTEKSTLGRQIARLSLQESVILMGKQSDLDMVYNRASIFVLNSRYEGFPNSLLEAMANGCAVISSNCEFGPGEIIEDNVNGLLFKVGDNEELQAKLEILISEKELRERLGSKARAVSEEYSFKRFFDSFEGPIDEFPRTKY